MIDKKTEFNEECWIIYGYKWRGAIYGWMKYESKGTPGSVNFDWQKVIRNSKKIIGFTHTHPNGYPSPSSIDDNTMVGWVKALGKPLLCGIESKGNLKMFLYERFDGIVQFREIEFKKIGMIITIKDWMR